MIPQKFEMDFRFFWITFWVTLRTVSSHFDLPDTIYELCPYSDVCNKTASKSLNVEGLIPCCSSCKCDEKCGLRLDCCFDDMDNYRLKDNGIVACITPRTTEKNKLSFDGAYWMIQTCLNNMGDSVQTNRNISCELYDKKGKSIIEPVSSTETGNIYVNEKCAICNSVYNYTKWNYLYLLSHPQVGPFVWKTKDKQDSHSEPILYIPPEDEDWSMRRCISKFQKTCNTNSTFDKLCHTLNMPYITNRKGLIRNPFCALCEERVYLQKVCKNELRRTYAGRLTVLIDSSVKPSSKLYKNEMINNMLKSDCPMEVSAESDLNTCVPIYCSNGMLLTPTGCKYFIRRWYIPSFTIKFRLLTTFENELPAETLDALTLDDRKNPLLWMKIPCREVKADIIEVYSEVVNDGQMAIESFIVRLWKTTPDGIDPSVMLPVLTKCLKYNWYINILGKAYTFRPTLDKYSSYIQDGRRQRSRILTSEVENATRPKLYERIAIGPKPLTTFNFLRPTVLLKTFFCDQIIIPVDAVVLLFQEIQIISKNVTLGDNEFAVNLFMTKNRRGKYQRDLNKTTFSVCLEDYDTSYYQMRSWSSTSSRTLTFVQLVIFFAVSQLISF